MKTTKEMSLMYWSSLGFPAVAELKISITADNQVYFLVSLPEGIALVLEWHQAWCLWKRWPCFLFFHIYSSHFEGIRPCSEPGQGQEVTENYSLGWVSAGLLPDLCYCRVGPERNGGNRRNSRLSLFAAVAWFNCIVRSHPENIGPKSKKVGMPAEELHEHTSK